MRTSIVFAAAFLLPVSAVFADATLHMKSGQDIVVQKVKVSDGCLVVVEDGVMKRIAFTDLANSSLQEYGVDVAKIDAQRKEAAKKAADAAEAAAKPTAPATAASATWKPRDEDDAPWLNHSTTPKAKTADAKPAKDVASAAAAKPAHKPDNNIRKINQATDLIHAKFAGYAEDAKNRFPSPSQAAEVQATLNSDQDKLCGLVSSLKPGMTRQVWESMVASNLGAQAKYQKIVQDDRLLYNAAKVVYRKERFILVIEYDKAGALVDWSCDIQQ